MLHYLFIYLFKTKRARIGHDMSIKTVINMLQNQKKKKH